MIFDGTSIYDSVSQHQDEITAMMQDGGKEVAEALADPKSRRQNCGFTLKTRSRLELTHALIFIPIAGDIFATEKCLARELYAAQGLLGTRIDGESVAKRTDATLLPTEQDRHALTVQYINQIEPTAKPSDMIAIIEQARKRGLLK
jgi:hypothetical protein